jgi:ATP-binding cassette, subfamily C, bacterial exporter for protease/lipase
MLFRREFLWVAVFSMVANLLMLAPTIYLLQLFDRVMISMSEYTLYVVTLIFVFFILVMGFTEWVRSRLLVRLGIRFGELLNDRVFKSSFAAALQNRLKNPMEVFNDLTNLRQFLTGNGIIAFFDLPWTPIYIGVVFMLHPVLGLVALLFTCIQLFLTYYNNRQISTKVGALLEANTDSSNFIYSKLRNAEPIESMGMLKNFRARWLGLHQTVLRNAFLISDKQSQQSSFLKFVRYCMQSATLGLAALLVIMGELSVGAMIAANVLMNRALQPMDLILNVWKDFIQARVSFMRLEQHLEDYGQINAGTFPHTPTGEVTLSNLLVNVEGCPRPILDGLTLNFPAGRTTVVIGPSGSGKSSLAKAVLGLWPALNGAVKLDGMAIDQWDRAQLGKYLGYLPQDVELFEGTIAENIARFDEVDSTKVVDAAKRTGIHEMILRMPKGYDTSIGEAGGLLSGGQRQRIGLARAIYGNPSLIVLDEPNANLDEVGEQALMQSLLELKKAGKTIVMITHKMNALAIADDLLVMKNGKVAYYGFKEDVLKAMQEDQAKAQSEHNQRAAEQLA